MKTNLAHLAIAAFISFSGTFVCAEERIVVDSFDMNVMRGLEEKGFSLSRQLGATGTTAQELYASPAYKSFADDLMKELELQKKAMNDNNSERGEPDHGHQYRIKGIADNAALIGREEMQGEAPRRFDPKWLTSPIARFHLVAVVNRIDRKDFDTADKTCGETRLLYRLAYHIPNPNAQDVAYPIQSSLPFVVNLVYQNALVDGSCKSVLNQWKLPTGQAVTAEWLAGTPLKQLNRFKQLEVNFQSFRFSSGYMRDFGGQAMYTLKIFKDNNGKLESVPLENMPDVANIKASPELKAYLVDYIRNNTKLIDEGRANIPDFSVEVNGQRLNLLAKTAISFATLGHSRLANKPFNEIFKEEDIPELNGLSYVNSKRGFIERLNNMSCVGCHQAGSTAGFHIVGMGDDRISGQYNQAAIAFSNHYYSEQKRRAKYLQAMNENEGSEIVFRPHSLTPVNFQAGVKDRCTLPTDKDKPFKQNIICDQSKKLQCIETARFLQQKEKLEGKLPVVNFGECVPEEESPEFGSGTVCRKADIVNYGGSERNDANEAKARARHVPLNFFDFMDVAYNAADHGTNAFYNGSTTPLFPLGSQTNPPQVRSYSVKGYNCGAVSAGAPLGRLQKNCAESADVFRLKKLKETLSGSFDITKPEDQKKMPVEMCAIRGSTTLSKCTDRWDAAACLDKFGSGRALLDTCYPGRSCREDYICQLMPNNFRDAKNKEGGGESENPDKWLEILFPDNAASLKEKKELIQKMKSQNIGFCTPTYFVFNMRLDGHPDPSGNLNIPLPKKNPDMIQNPDRNKEMLSGVYRGDYVPARRGQRPAYKGVYAAPECQNIPSISTRPIYCAE